MDKVNCPCGTNKPYLDCCKIVHLNINLAKTSEQLMRSRYSAFVFANGKYLNKSHYSKTRSNSKRVQNELVSWTKSVQWVKLEILNQTKGLKFDIEGTVEFKAYYFEKSKLTFIHENSSFIKENGHWVYKGIL